MWSLIILCAIVGVGASFPETFRKCCAKGQNLIKVIDSDGLDSFKCFNSVIESTISDYSLSSTVFVTEGVAVEYGMPKECDLEMIKFDDNVIKLSGIENHCYERLVLEETNGTAKQIIPKTIALVCTGTGITEGTDVKIQNLRKCCQSGQMYDTENNKCRDVDDQFDSQWFIKQLRAYGGKIFEMENGLNCKSVEYDVQLKDELFSMTLEGNTLNVVSRDGEGGILAPVGNWCVDREYSSRRLLARVCTRDCSSLGAYCVRKCCPIGYHYQPVQCGFTRSACVPSIDDEMSFDLSEYLNPLKERYGVGGKILLSLNIVNCNVA